MNNKPFGLYDIVFGFAIALAWLGFILGATAHAASWTEFATGNIIEAGEFNANFDTRTETILPLSATGVETDGTYDLGSSTYAWNNAYISGNIELTASRDQFISLSFTDLVGSTGNVGLFNNGTTGYAWPSLQGGDAGGGGQTSIFAGVPLGLPDGADFVSIDVRMRDGDGNIGMDLGIYQVDLFQGDGNNMTQIGSSFGTTAADSPNDTTKTMTTGFQANNSRYSYFLNIGWTTNANYNSNVRFYGAIIRYKVRRVLGPILQ